MFVIIELTNNAETIQIIIPTDPYSFEILKPANTPSNIVIRLRIAFDLILLFASKIEFPKPCTKGTVDTIIINKAIIKESS